MNHYTIDYYNIYLVYIVVYIIINYKYTLNIINLI